MSYRLLCTDIDGTLYNSCGEVTRRTRAAIDAAFAAGRIVTLATGRPPRALRRFAQLLPAAVPLICTNGAALADSASGKLLWERRLPAETVRALIARCRTLDVTLVVWQGEALFTEGDAAVIAAYEQGTDCRSRPVSELLRQADQSAGKLLLRGSGEAIAQSALTLAGEEAVDVFTSSPTTLEIVSRGFHKGYGLRRCAALLGVDTAEVVAVGDGRNDIPMLTAAGLGVAMGNSEPGVAEKARLIAPGNDEDGLAWVIENYLLA